MTRSGGRTPDRPCPFSHRAGHRARSPGEPTEVISVRSAPDGYLHAAGATDHFRASEKPRPLSATSLPDGIHQSAADPALHALLVVRPRPIIRWNTATGAYFVDQHVGFFSVRRLPAVRFHDCALPCTGRRQSQFIFKLETSIHRQCARIFHSVKEDRRNFCCRGTDRRRACLRHVRDVIAHETTARSWSRIYGRTGAHHVTHVGQRVAFFCNASICLMGPTTPG